MTTAPPAPDRRAQLKARHRQSILDAADALIAERGAPRFSVDELAAAADVSRRTVFNHFASLDDVVMTACTRVLTGAIDEFRAAAAASTRPDGGATTVDSLFAETVGVVRGMDLAPIIASIWRMLGSDEGDPRSQPVIQDVFARITDELAAELSERSGLDALDVDILVSSLMNGIAVVAKHWITETGAVVDAATRARWRDLLDRMVAAVAAGYRPAAADPPAG